MGYEILIDEQHGIAEIRLVEQIPHSDHVKARDELIEICRVRRIHKVLVDASRLSGSPPAAADLFNFGASWAELALRTPIYFAGVLPQDTVTREWWRFGETVAVNRGVVTRAFRDFDEARAWLRDA